MTPPSVRDAMASYTFARADQCWHLDREQCHRCRDGWPTVACHRIHQAVDAASLTYDLAVAEASIERTRQGVAW